MFNPISHDDGLIPAIMLLLIALKMLKCLNLFLEITGLAKHTAPVFLFLVYRAFRAVGSATLCYLVGSLEVCGAFKARQRWEC